MIGRSGKLGCYHGPRLGRWLRSLGLERYEAAFRENEIDETVLPKLTAEDLKELGVGALGHRRKLLDAIAALRAETNKASPFEETTDGPAKDLAERRHPVPIAAATAPSAMSASVEAAGERRHVTVMFCDLVDSTGISGKLDAEDWRDLANQDRPPQLRS